MLNFKKINILDIPLILSYTKKTISYFCEHNYVDIFIWKDYYNTEIAFDENFLYIRIKICNNYVYLFPIGHGNILNAINNIENIMKYKKYKIISISNENKIFLETNMPNYFLYYTNRNNYDYIYSAENLIKLTGKKFHSKRNFINRFKSINKDWHSEIITDNNKYLVINFFKKWCNINNVMEKDIIGEKNALNLAIKYYEILKLNGEILYLNNDIIAFSIGNKTNNDIYTIQFEKANSDIIGSYQMINFIFANKYCNDVKYINREEDLGIEGLRKAKISYNPIFLAKKYIAVRNC